MQSCGSHPSVSCADSCLRATRSRLWLSTGQPFTTATALRLPLKGSLGGGQLSQMTVTTVTETADGQTSTETHTVDLTYDASSSTVAEFQMLDEKQKVKAIRLTNAKGASVRQLSRLTGISKGVVEKWLKQ